MIEPTPTRIEILKKLRQAQDWTLNYLADDSGVPIESLIAYENGEGELDVDQIFSVANALNTTIAKLLDDTNDNKGNLDTCHYCKRSYHPMPVWSRDDERIYVCSDNVWQSVNNEKSNCKSKANIDGFHHRPDLSYKR